MLAAAHQFMHYQLVYISRARQFVGFVDLANILDVSRRRNSDSKVSGMLLSADHSFIQVLEGSKENVEGIFTSILRDARHHSVSVLLRHSVHHRCFANWSMGFEKISSSHSGFAEVFQIGRTAIEERLGEKDVAIVRGFLSGFCQLTQQSY